MSLRLFAALDLPDDAAAPLLGMMKNLPGAKWRPRENLHLTLRFFGEVAEPVAEEIDAALAEVAAATRPFEVQLKGVGAFGKDLPHTLWVGVEKNAVLEKLAADCERAARRAGLKAEPRKFTPHVTLAYLGGMGAAQVNEFEQRWNLFEAPSFTAESFGLYSSWIRKSAPSLYRLEADYPLRG
ncbi:MAG: RNA 2',3'-cyclic phosphodiesterase [Hyphomonadaceae bacterium]|nr:RNA 2',3'-cyclic phosphodiesterase [Hyphomonadaceae bacterium]